MLPLQKSQIQCPVKELGFCMLHNVAKKKSTPLQLPAFPSFPALFFPIAQLPPDQVYIYLLICLLSIYT